MRDPLLPLQSTDYKQVQVAMDSRRRVWQHVFEDRSESQLGDAFESVGWVVQPLRRDYGEDLHARPFEDGHPTGQDFSIQLKGTDDVDQYRLMDGQWLSYPVELPNLVQWYSYTLPVIFVVWDITHRVGYWTHIQPFIRGKLKADPTWLENTSRAKEPARRVRVPTSQIIAEDNLDSLKPVIETEWRKIEQGKSHFEILYQARGDPIDDTLNLGLPPAISQQLRITELRAVVAAEPREARGWLDLATIYYEIDNMDEALKAINRAWDLDSENRNTKQVRACVLAEFARRNSGPPSMLCEAISLFQSTRSGPGDPMADYNTGNCYLELRQFQKAVEHYDRALSAEPDPQQAAQIWTNRGNAVDMTGNSQDAVDSFKKALELNPSLWNVHASWATLEVRRNNFESACKRFREAFRCNPELESSGSNVVYWFACSLHQIGELKEALSVMNQLLAASPLHKEGLLLKAHLLCELRRIDESYAADALSFFKGRLLDDPTDMLARSELNLIYLDQGLADERRKLLEETVALDNPPALVSYEYAMLLENDGRIDDAVAYLERAVEKHRGHLIVHALARLKRETGHYREAITYYKMALGDISDPLPILQRISDCYHSLNDYGNCVAVISKALVLGATEGSWWNNLCCALDELGIEPERYIGFLRRKLSTEEDVSDQEIRAKLSSLVSSAAQQLAGGDAASPR